MRLINPNREELVRRWPVWFARLANWFIRWTDEYCAAGCGYPIGSRFTVEIERQGETRILAGVCSLRGACEAAIPNQLRDDYGRRYSEIRPEIVTGLEQATGPVAVVRLTLSR